MTDLPHLQLKIALLHPNATFPKKAHESDACYDVTASEDVTVNARSTGMVPLGWAMELQEGWEAQLRGRSGLASRGIVAHLGTIDHLYRKEVKVILHNLTDSDFLVRTHDRVAQLTFAPVYPVTIKSCTLVETSRGGFGSTGMQ